MKTREPQGDCFAAEVLFFLRLDAPAGLVLGRVLSLSKGLCSGDGGVDNPVAAWGAGLRYLT